MYVILVNHIVKFIYSIIKLTILKALKYSWNDIDIMIDNLVEKIKPHMEETTIFAAIPKGGIIPATLLAKRLNAGVKITHNYGSDIIEEDVIFVDDIADTGETLQLLMDGRCASITSAVLVQKASSKYFSTFQGVYLDDTRWVQFPWESDDEIYAKNS